MKKNLLFLFLSIFVFGCGQAPKGKQVLATINNYEISLDEFSREFKDSPYATNGTPDSRNDFLNNLVNRKLMLQDAQKEGLDKDKDFLRMVEKFWEQSLLKLAIDKKSKEIAGLVVVNDKEIEDAYADMLKSGKTEKPYDQMYQQIKWQIMRAKQTQALNDWINELHRKAEIKINYDLLKQEK